MAALMELVSRRIWTCIGPVDKVKLEDFTRDHPGEKFPEYRTLTDEETAGIRDQIIDRLGLPYTVTGLELVKAVVDKQSKIPQVDAEEETPDFAALLRESGIIPGEKVLINWYRFDRIDEMSLDDFSKYFTDLWYPAADHIDIFDDSLSWILSIDYSGSVSLLKL